MKLISGHFKLVVLFCFVFTLLAGNFFLLLFRNKCIKLAKLSASRARLFQARSEYTRLEIGLIISDLL